MNCFHPVEIQANGFVQKVRCGHCLACLQHRQAEWTSRLRIELDHNPESCYFVTLTYSDENLPYFYKHELAPELGKVPGVCKADVRKFHMDLRKRFQQGFYMDDTLVKCGFRKAPSRIPLDSDTKFRYYVTSEYGPNGNRPHYHGFYSGLMTDEYVTQGLIEQIWNKGFVTVERARSEAAAAYVAKYLVNDSLVSPLEGSPRPFALMSNGLGESYLSNDSLVRWHLDDPGSRAYIPVGSDRQVLPRYLRDKIYIDQETGEDLRPVLREYAERKTAATLARESRMSQEELFEEMRQEAHREHELHRQWLWRFQKNGKVK